MRAAAAGQKAEQAPPRRAVPQPGRAFRRNSTPAFAGQALSRSGTAFTLKVGGAHLLPPPRSAKPSGGEGRTRARPRAGWGCFPEALRRRPGRGRRWPPWPNHRVVLVGISPRPATPHPYPSPPLGFAERGREEREAGLCESASPFGRGSRPARAGADPAHHDDGVMRIMPAPLGWIARVRSGDDDGTRRSAAPSHPRRQVGEAALAFEHGLSSASSSSRR